MNRRAIPLKNINVPLMFLFVSLYKFLNIFKIKLFRKIVFKSLKNKTEYALSPIGKEHFIIMTSDDIISRSVYINGSFDFEKVEKTIQLLGPDFKLKTLIDVGANIGTICIPALKRNMAQHAIAIEPEPKNFNLLNANIWLNNLSNKVEAHNIALGSENNQTLNFELSSSNSGDHRVQFTNQTNPPSKTHTKTISVHSRRYDDIVNVVDASSQLIWIDTQGYEGFVLQGAANATEARVPLVIEFWPYAIKRTNSFELLKKSMLKYEIFYDLSQQNPSPIKINEFTINSLYSSLGEDGNSTDLLLR